MNALFLMDLAPDPAPRSCFGVVVLGIIVLLIVAAMIGGLVFLLVWRKRRNLSVGPAP
ncbi:MAG: hypothetical protein JWM21_508 [Acidobacteria bacterium]|nr:hypothetical protein [Acidobacteriota bacterium]